MDIFKVFKGQGFVSLGARLLMALSGPVASSAQAEIKPFKETFFTRAAFKTAQAEKAEAFRPKIFQPKGLQTHVEKAAFRPIVFEFSGFDEQKIFSSPIQAERLLAASAPQKTRLKPSIDRQLAENRNFQAGGVVLVFREWPNEAESRNILAYTSERGLIKTGVLPLPGLPQSLIEELGLKKKWIFSWERGIRAKTLGAAYRICFKLPQTASLISCEPDYQNAPDSARGLNSLKIEGENLFNKAINSVRQWLGSFKKPKESSSLDPGPIDQPPSPPPAPRSAPVEPPPAPLPVLLRSETGNFKSCGIIPAYSLSYTQSSYYGGFQQDKSKTKTIAGLFWAQEMIGADFLKEELKKKLLKSLSQ